MLKIRQINAENRWISVCKPTIKEQHKLVTKYHVSDEMLEYAIDPYEKARVETDEKRGITLLIFDVYVPTDEIPAPQTAPIGIMLTEKDLLVFTNEETMFVNQMAEQTLEAVELEYGNKLDFALMLMYRLSVEYLEPLHMIDVKRQRLQNKILQRTGRRVINESMEIDTNLVYILTSLRGNVSLLMEFDRIYGHSMTDQQADYLDDIIVEAQQGLEMAQMISEVVERVSDAYGKVLDSDLNQTMKVLTVFSIVLSIPTIVSGFYGENVHHLPFADSPYAWQITVGIAVLLMIVTLVIVLNRRWYH